MSPRGRIFNQVIAREWASSLDELNLVCGRYEGVDQRVSDFMVDEELSVGRYVLAGGEIGALAVVETVSRLLPGVLGNRDSLNEESFGALENNNGENGAECCQSRGNSWLEYPQYTKPRNFKGWRVPEVLLGGNHKEIFLWRRRHSKRDESLSD